MDMVSNAIRIGQFNIDVKRTTSPFWPSRGYFYTNVPYVHDLGDCTWFTIQRFWSQFSCEFSIINKREYVLQRKLAWAWKRF